MNNKYMYIEIQKAKPWWAYFIIVPAVFAWWMFIQQIIFEIPFGNNPAPNWGTWLIVILCGILLPWVLLVSKQITKIDGKTIYVAYYPFWKTRFALDQVIKFYPREYSTMRDFWGWGIRFGKEKVVAYINFNTNKGIQFELKSGRKVLIGSTKPEEFFKTLNQI